MKKFGMIFFIKDIIMFLKKKNTDFTEEKNKERKKLFLEIEKFNKLHFNTKEEYLYIKNLKKKRRYIIIIYANLSYSKLQLSISVFLLCII